MRRVVTEPGKKNKKHISPLALNFERRNFADFVYAQTAKLHIN